MSGETRPLSQRNYQQDNMTEYANRAYFKIDLTIDGVTITDEATLEWNDDETVTMRALGLMHETIRQAQKQLDERREPARLKAKYPES